jgi:hypothetical protein
MILISYLCNTYDITRNTRNKYTAPLYVHEILLLFLANIVELLDAASKFRESTNMATTAYD